MEAGASSNDISGRVCGWVAAGWIGAVAGLADAALPVLHPTSPVIIPFAVSVYILVSVSIYTVALVTQKLLDRLLPGRFGVARACRELLDLTPNPPVGGRRTVPAGFALGLTVAVWIVFFGGYAVTTSSAAWFSSRTGLSLGLLMTLIAGSVGFILTRSICRRTACRADHGENRRRRRIGLVLVLLLLALLFYPAFCIPAWLLHSCSGPDGDGPPPRGFVLISLDAARGDRISALGYPRRTTPHVDRLIHDGAAFSRAYVQQPASGPGHACMLTGLPPLSHGLVANGHVLSDDVLTVAERLREEGFATAAFINNFFLESRFGFDQGFDCFINEFRASRLSDWNPRLLLRGLSLYHFGHRLLSPPGRRTDDTINLTLSWLKRRPCGDFFVFLHIMDPHSPYDPPPDLRREFYQPVGPPVHDTLELRQRMESLSAAEVNALRDLYDADVAYGDRKVGRLMDELERQGLLASTLIVVTADHGEVLYEKERVFDHGLIWNGDLHVPLVFCYPAKLPPGQVGEQPVPATALVATAFSLLGLPYREQTGIDLYGPLIEDGRIVERPPPATVLTISGLTDKDAAAAIGDRYKIIARNGVVSDLYDLSRDPTEQDNLWPQLQANDFATNLAQLADSMHAALQQWLQDSAEVSVGLKEQSRAEVDQETARRLRALGY